MIDIKIIQQLCKDDKLHWTSHVAKRMIRRMISPEEVIDVLLHGTIIEQYPNDYPVPSCLILGLTVNGRILHVVCSVMYDAVSIITAYQPDPNEWDMTFSKRREK